MRCLSWSGVLVVLTAGYGVSAAQVVPEQPYVLRARDELRVMPQSHGVRGRVGAPVTIVVFADFACPFSARLVPVIEDLFRKFPDDVRIVFKHNPLAVHVNAQFAHEAAMAAAAQGRFWEMHDRLFANQAKLTPGNLSRIAEQLGLDMKAFSNTLDGRWYRETVERDSLEAKGLGIRETPTLFVNGRRVIGLVPFALLKEIVDEELGGRFP